MRRIVFEHATGLRQILGAWDETAPLPSHVVGVDLIDHIGNVSLALVGTRHVLYREFIAPTPSATLETF